MTIKEQWNVIAMLAEKLKKQIGYVEDTAREIKEATNNFMEIQGLCGEEEYLAKRSTDNNQEHEPI